MKALAITSVVLGVLGLLAVSFILDLWVISLSSVIFAIAPIIKKRWRAVAIIGLVLGVGGIVIILRDSIIYDATQHRAKIAGYIYQHGREWTYKASFIDTTGDTIDSQKVTLKIPGGRLYEQWTTSEWVYTYSDTSFNSINGVKENDDGIWLTPPITGRGFRFVERTVYPYVIKPLKEGEEKISENREAIAINLDSKHGEKGIKRGRSPREYYRIVEQKDISTLLGDFTRCWQIDTKTEREEGVYKATFYFHEKYGFVRWEYTKPDSSKVILDLEKVSGFEK